MSYDKEFRVIKPFDSPKGVLSVGTLVTFPSEKSAEHHLKFGFVEPASFEAPKKRILEDAPVPSQLSKDFKVSDAVNMLSGMNISQARSFTDGETRKGVLKALKELIQANSEKNIG